jgi:hypothetical protein
VLKHALLDWLLIIDYLSKKGRMILGLFLLDAV